jgi:membrane-anchored protein YejM (alkaline phosphatase superfamily)
MIMEQLVLWGGFWFVMLNVFLIILENSRYTP